MKTNPQGTAQWFSDRLGKVTASKVWTLCARQANGKHYKAREDYKAEIILERLTGKVQEHFVSDAMERGTLLEEHAALQYAMEFGAKVEFSPFVDHPEIPNCGASPDRLVGDVGGLEIKCPLERNHLKFIMSGSIDKEYFWQCMHGMACTQRNWWDLYYYHPDFPPNLQSRRVRIARDSEKIELLETEILVFNEEVEAAIADLKKIQEAA